jgi:hypothetical protein
MAIDVSTFHSYLDDGITALAGGDYATAMAKFLAAKAVLAGLPDGTVDGDETKFSRADLDQLIQQARQGSAADTGIQRAKVKYIATSE